MHIEVTEGGPALHDEQITFGEEKSSSGDHKLDGDVLTGFPLDSLKTTPQ